MEKTQKLASINEIVFGSASSRESTAISRDVRAGRLRRIAPDAHLSVTFAPLAVNGYSRNSGTVMYKSHKLPLDFIFFFFIALEEKNDSDIGHLLCRDENV